MKSRVFIFIVYYLYIVQALLRGALVRKQIEDVKKSFEAVFQDLERNDTELVEWENLLSVPKVS